MLFKPWQCAADLCDNHSLWIAAFYSWRDGLGMNDSICAKLNNIQLLHECKDAQDSQLSLHQHCNNVTHFISPVQEDLFMEELLLDHELLESSHAPDFPSARELNPVLGYTF